MYIMHSRYLYLFVLKENYIIYVPNSLYLNIILLGDINEF